MGDGPALCNLHFDFPFFKYECPSCMVFFFFFFDAAAPFPCSSQVLEGPVWVPVFV